MTATATAQAFTRNDELFSLCGLNCGQCPMHVRGDCTGCRAGSWCARVCKIAPCSIRHGRVDYCFECPEYPCPKYDGIDKRDSLISHRNQLSDMAKAKHIGIDAYRDEQRAKTKLLRQLLEDFDDGTHDVFFYLAANMLDVEDLREAVMRAEHGPKTPNRHAMAQLAERELRAIAHTRNVPLELRQWDGPW